MINNIIKKNGIDGIMLGTVDVLLDNYLKVSNKNNLPCYVNKKSLKAFSTKNNAFL